MPHHAFDQSNSQHARGSSIFELCSPHHKAQISCRRKSRPAALTGISHAFSNFVAKPFYVVAGFDLPARSIHSFHGGKLIRQREKRRNILKVESKHLFAARNSCDTSACKSIIQYADTYVHNCRRARRKLLRQEMMTSVPFSKHDLKKSYWPNCYRNSLFFAGSVY